jgi:hypothetical protein
VRLRASQGLPPAALRNFDPAYDRNGSSAGVDPHAGAGPLDPRTADSFDAAPKMPVMCFGPRPATAEGTRSGRRNQGVRTSQAGTTITLLQGGKA